MKRTERHHLKENEIERLTLEARRVFAERQGEAKIVLAIVGVVLVLGIGYFLWRERVLSQSHALLAEALATQEAKIAVLGTPSSPSTFPSERARLEAAMVKFKAAADAYPSTDAGLFARYRLAAGQLALGNPTAAVATYQDLMQRAGSGLYSQVARLGLAEAQVRAGQFDQAITAFKDLAQRKDGPMPVDGILMQLGRAYRDAGKSSDAQQTFNRLVAEFPESPFMADAKRELEALNKTT
jgi:TolA-binding protein